MTDAPNSRDSLASRNARARNPGRRNPGRRKSASGFMALEPRIMYDAAAVATTNDAADSNHHDATTPDHVSGQAVTPSNANGSQPSQTDASAADNIQAAQITQLVVIDAAVPDKQVLLDGLKPGELAFILNGESNGVQQIADYIRDNNLHDLTAIQIVSHGADGAIDLGSITLSSGNIPDYADALAEIGAALAEGGDILLYGCNVASTSGTLFLANLSAATGGADIAASIDHTGSAALGGDWTLEASTGAIEASTPFTAAALAAYPDLLANETLSATQTTSVTISGDLDGDGVADPGETVTTDLTGLF